MAPTPEPSTVAELLAAKRDGVALSASAIRRLIEGFTRGEVADYQMSAFAMAVCTRGLSMAETTALTLAMRDSGRVLALRGPPGRRIDKHSTGGVGDKVSLCLAPLVAACGVRVPMVSGRGLGHTGGTLDKLEAIPGFRVDLTAERLVAQVEELGCALAGQTDELAPADRALYALRDVTGTVESIPLITASILSKKLAAGIDGLVLDVKVGQGAFMKTLEDARALAGSLVKVGRHAGTPVRAVLTAMEAPLGRAIGNALETAEAIAVLHGEGPEDVREVTLALGGEMLRMAALARSGKAARRRLEAAIEDRTGLEVLRRVITAQGGDPRVVDEPDRLPAAPTRLRVRSPATGVVQGIDALALGRLAMALGAGRQRAEDVVDPAVGVVLAAGVGDRVEAGQELATLHVRAKKGGRALRDRAAAAFRIGRSARRLSPLVIETRRR
ncbi:MAG: thymidine phosphorylase [Sandaracinaceae bacterium]